MKVLSVRQPFATLIVTGEKKIETRPAGIVWAGYRGELGIHSSATWTKEEQSLCYMPAFKDALARHGYYSHHDLPLGKILGQVDMVKSHSMTAEWIKSIKDLREYIFGYYAPERIAIHFDKAQQYENLIPATGHLGLWNYDVESLICGK
jgi:hypothetical protein